MRAARKDLLPQNLLTTNSSGSNTAMSVFNDVEKSVAGLSDLDGDAVSDSTPDVVKQQDDENVTLASRDSVTAIYSDPVPQRDGDDRRDSSNPIDLSDARNKYKKGVSMPVTIEQHLHKDPQLESSSVVDTDLSFENAIQWETFVYDHEMIENGRMYKAIAVAKYVDDRPMNPASLVSKRRRDDVDTASMSATSDFSRWSGPVLIISYSVQAWLPHIKCTYPRSTYPRRRHDDYDSDSSKSFDPEDSKPTRNAMRSSALIHNKDDLPKSLDGHDIESCTHPTLVIKSPYLYQELSELVVDYPYCFESIETFPTGFERRVDYPFVKLLHCYPKILERLSAPVKATESTEPTLDPRVMLSDASGTKKFKKDPELARSHLKTLQMYLQPIYDSETLVYRKALSEPKQGIHFETLWNFFKPGTMVYVTDEWTPWYASIVFWIRFTSLRGPESDCWAIDHWVLSSDGVNAVKELTSLKICPTSVWDAVHGDHRRRQGLSRGQFLERAFRRGHLLATYSGTEAIGDLGHTGKVVVDHRRGVDMTGLKLGSVGLPLHPKDPFSHYDEIYLNNPWQQGPEDLSWRNEMQPSLNIDPPPPTESWKMRRNDKAPARTRKNKPLIASRTDDPEDDDIDVFKTPAEDHKISEPLTDEQHLLIYPLTFGFSLKSKIWLELDATRLQHVPPSNESMDNLIFVNDPNEDEDEAPEKQLILALAGRLEKPETWSVDHIEGKGAGGIILLHGPPGVGKTYTVESIADMLERPLLALSVADIGTVETAIERELSKWFALAELWRAVLLIDEADIFLERRQTKDLARNGLVSAFLRRAEYFSGLLFLTTNRVGHIDDAFISRVHVAIRYRNLNGLDLARVWKGFFKRLSNDKSVRVKIPNSAKTWVIKQFESGSYNGLNGRDIRNALQTAITLAKYDHERDPDHVADEEDVIVTESHFKRVLDMSRNFRNYVDSIRNQDEKKRASERGERNDYERTELSIRDKIKAGQD